MTTPDESNPKEAQQQLFMLRFWPEDLGDGRWEWRSKVQHINSGEVRYFRDWPALENFVNELVKND